MAWFLSFISEVALQPGFLFWNLGSLECTSHCPVLERFSSAARGRSELIRHPMFDLSEVGLEADVPDPARMCPWHLKSETWHVTPALPPPATRVDSRRLAAALPHLRPTTYHLPPLFSTTFLDIAGNYVCFQQHSRFASEFSTAVLCFQ